MTEPVVTPPSPPGAPPGGDAVSAAPLTPRDAALLNLFFIAAAYFVIGQWRKGLAALVVAAVVVVVTLGYALPLVAILTAFDGYLQTALLARGTAVGQWTWFNRQLE